MFIASVSDRGFPDFFRYIFYTTLKVIILKGMIDAAFFQILR
jgi:hypothetical protein